MDAGDRSPPGWPAPSSRSPAWRPAWRPDRPSSRSGSPRPDRTRTTGSAPTASTAWHYVDPDHTTTFEPWNYRPGDDWAEVAATGGRPIFDGGFALGTGLVVTPLTALRTRSTGLRFIYTQWQRFTSAAILLNGGLSSAVTSTGVRVTTETDFTAGGVTFYGNYFASIGNAWDPAQHLGYGAILANNSQNDVYQNNHFVQIRNTAARSDTIHIHAIYGAHGSSNALIQGNAFQDITGDAVRQRDRSHGTQVIGNTLNGLYPQGITGRRTVYCFDQRSGLCPADRIAVRQ